MSIILLACLAMSLKPIPVFSIAGKHFVASCPWLRKDSICTAYITTSENRARVSISDVRNNKLYSTRKFSTTRSSPIKYVLANYKTIAVALSQSDDGLLSPKVVQSDEPIRVIVMTYLDQMMFKKSDAILLTPENSCHTSYYTVTANANPFFAIFSFDYPITNVKVKFPLYKNSFSVNCFASDKCSPGKTSTIRLLNYDLWYFTLDDKEANLLNVHITSDLPVYVVSGNRYGWSGRDDVSWDICTTSIKPSSTWGKEYVVANVVSGSVSFAISTIDIPFTVIIHEGRIKTRFVVSSTQHDLLDYDASENTLALTSDYPFGLYQVFLSRSLGDHDLGDVSILNLIPVEQWKRSSFYVGIALPSTFQVKIYLVTDALRDHLVLPYVLEDGFRLFEWHLSDLSVGQKTYSVAEFQPKSVTATFYVNNPKGRMMLYVTILPNVLGSFFFATHPSDFYQGEIYQGACMASGGVCFHDGTDNDCDGYVDEETRNGVDDDGDGLVDEDVVEPYSDGQWSLWTYACDQPCNGVKLTVKVRSCLNKSYDGNPCDGESVQCDQKTCPRNCERSESNPNGCFCNAACLSCEDNLFECDGRCKPEYTLNTNCLEQFPVELNDEVCLVKRVEENFSLANSKQEGGGDGAGIDWVNYIIVPFIVAFSVFLAAVLVAHAHLQMRHAYKANGGELHTGEDAEAGDEKYSEPIAPSGDEGASTEVASSAISSGSDTTAL